MRLGERRKKAAQKLDMIESRFRAAILFRNFRFSYALDNSKKFTEFYHLVYIISVYNVLTAFLCWNESSYCYVSHLLLLAALTYEENKMKIEVMQII